MSAAVPAHVTRSHAAVSAPRWARSTREFLERAPMDDVRGGSVGHPVCGGNLSERRCLGLPPTYDFPGLLNGVPPLGGANHGAAALGVHVIDVVLGRPEEQVVGVHARRVVAAVADEQAVWDRPAVDEPRETRRWHGSEFGEARGGEGPVRTLTCGRPLPLPALVGSGLSDSFPEALDGIAWRRLVASGAATGDGAVALRLPGDREEALAAGGAFALGSYAKRLADEVLGVDAQADPAAVAHLVAHGDLVPREQPRQTMRERNVAALESQPAVSEAARLVRPEPASVTPDHLAPESFRLVRGEHDRGYHATLTVQRRAGDLRTAHPHLFMPKSAEVA